MAKHFTNEDKILQAVLSDAQLIKKAEFNPMDYPDIPSALDSENPTVCAIAKIISGCTQNSTESTIYKEVSNYLKDEL